MNENEQDLIDHKNHWLTILIACAIFTFVVCFKQASIFVAIAGMMVCIIACIMIWLFERKIEKLEDNQNG